MRQETRSVFARTARNVDAAEGGNGDAISLRILSRISLPIGSRERNTVMSTNSFFFRQYSPKIADSSWLTNCESKVAKPFHFPNVPATDPDNTRLGAIHSAKE
jgi:hypothetical protein